MTETTEAEVLGALGRWPSPWAQRGWFVLPKVRCSTGYGNRRPFSDIKTRKIRFRTTIATIDALAMNAWKSQDYAINGLEVKLSRADWLREKRDPVKTEIMRRYCDGLYVVAPPGVVRLDLDNEIGVSWGYAEINRADDGRLAFKIVVSCPKLPGSPNGMLPRSFVASVLRAHAPREST